MERKKLRRKSKSGLKKESGRWRPTKRQVLWAISMVVTLGTIALLVVQLYPGLWEDVSREPVALLKGRVATLIGIGVALLVLIVLLAMGSASLGWTGFRGKTVWDFLQLLIVPLMLVAIGFLFTAQQDARQQEIEKKRAKAERELAEQRAQDEALQAYLDQMGSLLLDKDLRNSEEDSEVRTLARARTLTVLSRLGPERKGSVVQFLQESALLERPIVRLVEADLSKADLNLAFLGSANLRRADLRKAEMIGAQLSEANLSRADLSGANLSRADLSLAFLGSANLSNANLDGANLNNADLPYANLPYANLPYAYLRNADLRNADLPYANLRYADLSGADLSDDADLSDATLSDANLRDANLPYANLRNADLSNADLSNAALSNADLSNTKASKEQLDQADSLEGATMPDGKVSFDEFEPALSLRVSDHWSVNVEEKSTDQVSIDEYLKPGEISFTNPLHVFDLMNPSEPKKLPKKLPEPENAEEWVSWFQNHPNLDTSKPAPASVGDTPGMQIDVTVSTMPKDNSQDFPGQFCFPLYSLSDGSPIVWCGGEARGWKHRFVIVDVGGETVLIDASARSDRFDEFLPKAQKVLDSVEWKSG